ncbi:tRNA-uridine aminocarboxypropyltransferase [Vibrio neptunius]|uniref:tRNA-uridine aminocarboxypropyltransferase n=1 Tax=Vibrio neptunius TaxID=170651 RepID=A0ABS3A9Q6_9VIBR|nr:DTW domain-containing protein [Vibrio neptunius]MBN3495099.1 DTW domain-containing protein [Vibrio neptunius]MBN3517539.1 DTW domain-containing protein [Vibrio neptunius]MBN3551876.1 DTW domain-containing protein [Vibrio neptunius]MBN3579884.1 DTW domain-containing protein [Vibrio neptunius]MCH9873550.1 DTW domain-containing protein [Vibrio neptunius]
MSTSSPCPKCLLNHNCVCKYLPNINVPAHLAILMHENECQRETNTGQWLLKTVHPSSQHIWQRKQPCSELAQLINHEGYQPLLLFPGQDSLPINQITRHTEQKAHKPLFIILDGTWQEARKMLRKSPWLQALPKVHLAPASTSNYQLRRNQDEGHLCTLEVGAEIIGSLGQEPQAEHLRQFLSHYMKAFQADKSGHALK